MTDDIHNRVSSLFIYKNKTMCFVGKTGVELGIVMLSEISETHKDKYCIFSLIVEFEGHDSTKG